MGPTGRVVGVDVQRIEPLPERNVVTVCGDVTRFDVQGQVQALCGGKADVVLSDLAPKLSGVKASDDAREQALADCVLRFATQVLKPGGTLVVKLFMGADVQTYLAQLRTLFQDVRAIRPEATRKRSAEIYAIASGFGRGTGTA